MKKIAVCLRSAMVVLILVILVQVLLPSGSAITPAPQTATLDTQGTQEKPAGQTLSAERLLVLVNANHPWSGEDPSGLVTLAQAIACRNITLKNRQMRGQEEAVFALQELADALADAGLGALRVTSAYRTPSYQQGLFDNKVQRVIAQGVDPGEAEGVAAQEVTRPGTSEHHTGLAFDLMGEDNTLDGFVHTQEYLWIKENAALYGFIIRYPEDKKAITGIIHEPWHLRYVGADAARVIAQEGICLEEYIEKYGQ